MSPRTPWARLWHWRRSAIDACDRAAVLVHVEQEGALAPRYAFMTVLSSGIATLGLLQNSVAVIIGAMLISPLMGPIIQLGMGLATFSFASVRRAIGSLAVGVVLALAIAVAIVSVSPLKDATPEIIARTDPTLFDLLIAVLSGLAGAYATVTRKGETIVGVAIATALMPPLAVAGYGLALHNPHVAGGAAFLFMTNLLAIALSVTVMARIYGFEGADSPRQSAFQAAIVVGSFVVLSLPLGVALQKIVARTQTERAVRSALDDSAGEVGGRVTTLRVDSDANPLLVDAVFMTPRFVPGLDAQVEATLHRELRRDVHVQLREVVTTSDDTDALRRSTLDELRKSVEKLQDATLEKRTAQDAAARRESAIRDAVVARLGALQSLDDGRVHQLRLRADSGLTLAAAQTMEKSVGGDGAGRTFLVVPPVQPLPMVSFAPHSTALDDTASHIIDVDAWAVSRWAAAAVSVTADVPARDTALALTRAQAVAAILRGRGVTVRDVGTSTARDAKRADVVQIAVVSPD